MDILNTFGFNWMVFLGQVFNFLVLAVIFKMFLYKPILKVLKDREEKIQSGLENAEKTKAILEKTDAEKEAILRKTRVEAQEIIENTRKMSEELRQELAAKSKEEADKILAQAKEQAEQEMRKMEKQAQVLSLDLSQKVLSNVLQTLFSEEEKERILKKAVEKIGSSGGTSLPS